MSFFLRVIAVVLLVNSLSSEAIYWPGRVIALGRDGWGRNNALVVFLDVRTYPAITGTMNKVTYREKPQWSSFPTFLVPLWCNKSLIEEADWRLKHHTKAALFVIFPVQQFTTYLITYHLNNWAVTLPSVLAPWWLSYLFFFFVNGWNKSQRRSNRATCIKRHAVWTLKLGWSQLAIRMALHASWHSMLTY